MNKLQTIKNNTNKGITNMLMVLCHLSGLYIASGNAICLNIKNNNTTYISKDYLKHTIFKGLKISDKYKIDLLTLVYLGATLHNVKTGDTFTINPYDDDTKPNYIVSLKCGIELYLYDNDASVKKHFNLLKLYKTTSIKQIDILDYFKHYQPQNDFKLYPPYLKKKNDFDLYGLGYNPDSKKTIVKFW